jgi:sugar phosphate isomerase/epimerase
MPRCHLVQVSDYVLGDRGFPCRAVPGDGGIPLEEIISWILEAGYQGPFDLELFGPRIEREGHYEAVARTGDRLGEMLIRLGA